jgi:acetyltransferase
MKHFTMKNGERVLLRPIRPEDEPLEEEMFRNLSRQSIYFRFFGYIPQVNHKFLIRFTQIDYDREMAIIAELDKEGKKQMLGVVRLISDTWDESAEFAIVVADPWQNNGLGAAMMDFILEIARVRNQKKIVAEVLITNRIMLLMFEKRGFQVKRGNNGSYQVELNMTLNEELKAVN